MATLINDELSLSLDLVLTGLCDTTDKHSDAYMFINYFLCLKYGNEIIEINDKCISIRTMDYFINGIRGIIDIKRNGSDLSQEFEVNPLDNSFYMKFSERGVAELICIELWFNKAILTDGKIVGFKEGFQFDTHIDAFQTFYEKLQTEYKKILGD